MNFWQVVKNRHSVRSFDPNKKLSEEQIEKILEAGQEAPSAGNIKDFRFFVVESQDKKEQLAKAAENQGWIAEAPAIFVIASDLAVCDEHYANRGIEMYSYMDCAMAGQNILLAVTDMGLGATPVGAFEDEEVRDILGTGNDIKPMLIIPVGYPV